MYMSDTVTQNHEQIDQILTAMSQVFRAIEATMLPAWATTDLTMAQMKAAMFLTYEGPMTIGHLACALGIGQPAASILVDRLVQLGLVNRMEDPADRRRTIASLTPRGLETIGTFRNHRLQCLRAWLERLDADTLSALARGVQGIAAVVSAETVRPAKLSCSDTPRTETKGDPIDGSPRNERSNPHGPNP